MANLSHLRPHLACVRARNSTAIPARVRTTIYGRICFGIAHSVRRRCEIEANREIFVQAGRRRY